MLGRPSAVWQKTNDKGCGVWYNKQTTTCLRRYMLPSGIAGGMAAFWYVSVAEKFPLFFPLTG